VHERRPRGIAAVGGEDRGQDRDPDAAVNTGSGLARIVSFNDPRLFEVFGLPETTLRSA
jgi:hypothetical protein